MTFPMMASNGCVLLSSAAFVLLIMGGPSTPSLHDRDCSNNPSRQAPACSTHCLSASIKVSNEIGCVLRVQPTRAPS